jgi:hypothetical protein
MSRSLFRGGRQLREGGKLQMTEELANVEAEIREVVEILEAGEERLQRLIARLPDPEARLEHERNLDPDLDLGLLSDLQVVLHEALRPAIRMLRRLWAPAAAPDDGEARGIVGDGPRQEVLPHPLELREGLFGPVEPRLKPALHPVQANQVQLVARGHRELPQVRQQSLRVAKALQKTEVKNTVTRQHARKPRLAVVLDQRFGLGERRQGALVISLLFEDFRLVDEKVAALAPTVDRERLFEQREGLGQQPLISTQGGFRNGSDSRWSRPRRRWRPSGRRCGGSARGCCGSTRRWSSAGGGGVAVRSPVSRKKPGGATRR